MRYLALLATYALVAALVLPGSIVAQDDEAPGTATTPAEPAPEEPPPAPAEPAPAPTATETAPAPQPLGDEGGSAPDPTPKPKALAAASGSVTIADFDFAPATITINRGDTVTWNNDGPTPHSATANDGSFDTGILNKGQSGSHTFNQAGTFSYFCKPHPFMKASVVVEAAQSSGGGGGGGSGSGGGAGSSGNGGGDGGGGGATASQADDGPSLPDTGSDSRALLVLGGLLLILGIGMHRRAAAGEPRPAGRIGW